MPIYEFRCERCDSLFEQILPVGDHAGKCCPECGEPARRVISRSSFQLKGSGWYATDYRAAGRSAGERKGGGDGTSSAAGG